MDFVTSLVGHSLLNVEFAADCLQSHGIKGFVIPTKSFVKIGITKIFCYYKMFSSISETFGCCSKIFGCNDKRNYLLSLILLP